MKYCIKKVCIVILIISFCFNASGCFKPFLIHPEFKQRHKQIFSAAIMEPDVDAYMLMFNGDQKRMTDLLPLMRRSTLINIENALRDKGYQVKNLNLTERVLKHNPELRTALFNVRGAFDKALNDIAKRRKKKFVYSIGSEVNIFADKANCDVLVFVKELGIKKSAGEVAKEVTKEILLTTACALIGVVRIPIPKISTTMLTIAVVDSNDGAILWYIDNKQNTGFDPQNKEHLFMLAKSLIKHFPDAVNKGKDKKIDVKEGVEFSEKLSPKNAEIVPVSVKPVGM